MRSYNIHDHAKTMIRAIIDENMPEPLVKKAVREHTFSCDKIHVLAIGKAAWTMAKAASDALGDSIYNGIVITKHGHSKGEIPNMAIYEAGHPIPDGAGIAATAAAVEMARSLGAGAELLFLISGGGSALFELPMDGVQLADLADVNKQLLAAGADIVEVNTLRKRLSKVKAGRFAQIAAPAKIFSVILSDVLGDRLDSIASGPAAPDFTTADEAVVIVEKYGIKLNSRIKQCILTETPRSTDNVETVIVGSVRGLCQSAAASAAALGYTPYILTTEMNCEAREAGRFLGAIARDVYSNPGSTFKKPCAIIAGGETVVTLSGMGKGGRNQELALAAAPLIAGLESTLLFSLGSDGTDGPTDAAGGIIDGTTYVKLQKAGLNIDTVLRNNDSYRALSAVGGLIKTGPTGTNVNDVTILLCDCVAKK